MDVQTEVVTPEKAQQWLEANTRNRTLSRRKVRLYADDMKKHRWTLHHQGIAFYEDGELADGQHRLAAVIESGKEVEMMVVRKLPKGAGADIDRHRTRGEADAIRIGGLADWIGKTEVHVIKALASVHGNHPNTFTAKQIADIGKHVEKEVGFAINAFIKKQRFVTTAPVMAAIAIASAHYEHDRLMEFAEVLCTGMSTNRGDMAAIKLREKLIREHGGPGGTSGRRDVIYMTLRVIELFFQHKDVDRLHIPHEMPLRLAVLDELV